MSSAPTIASDRLILRPHKITDFEPFYSLLASDRAAFMDGPYSRKQSWYWLASEVGSWSLKGFGSWGVVLRKNATLIGQIGINQPEHFPEIKIGWIFFINAEGKGFAAEAARTALYWARNILKPASLVSYIHPKNRRSIALASRLGATHDPAAELPEGQTPSDTIVYRHSLGVTPCS